MCRLYSVVKGSLKLAASAKSRRLLFDKRSGGNVELNWTGGGESLRYGDKFVPREICFVRILLPFVR